MKKILMINYYGTCDKSGEATGHLPKVTKEYKELFQSEDQVSLAASPCIVDGIGDVGFCHVYQLPYDIMTENYNNLWKRIADKFKILTNVHQAFQIAGYDIIWFYRVDFFLLLYMMFQKKAKGKQICLVYQMSGGKGVERKIFDYVYKKGMRKFDGIIYTQSLMKVPVEKNFYMPDYWYKKEIYDQYASWPKEKKAVCLGTMNPYKKLEELVSVFNDCGFPLEIIGHFFDKERAEKLRRRAKSNIKIDDCILNEVEYYNKLGSARYAVLPYDMDQYRNRTSGILLESVFLGVIPIAPEELLRTNGLSGISYSSISEISEKISGEWDAGILRENIEKIKNNFDEDSIKDRFRKWLSSL